MLSMFYAEGEFCSLSAEGFKINRRMLATMSPYINRNSKAVRRWKWWI